MSDVETSNASDGDIDLHEYRCKKCPGKSFSAAEIDSHRAFHRGEKKKPKPGPKSKTRRGPSPVPSDVTLFERIEVDDAAAGPSITTRSGKRRRPVQEKIKPKKITSKKQYDDTVMGDWTYGRSG